MLEIAWIPVGKTDEYGEVPLLMYASSSRHECIEKIMERARNEGFRGSSTERLDELKWEVRKFQLTPAD